jgi:hypothetical protein
MKVASAGKDVVSEAVSHIFWRFGTCYANLRPYSQQATARNNLCSISQRQGMLC